MSFYAKYVLPRLTDLAMRNKVARLERARFVYRARGVVLEVGVGSGLNLPLYSAIERLYALDPSAELLRMAQTRAARVAFPVEFMRDTAEAIPLPDASVDTIVTTWTLCTIPDPVRAVEEMRRVLRPDGRLIFIEHGRSPDARVARWQDRVTPLWRRVAGGCHLNRRIDALLSEDRFIMLEIERGYVRGPRLGGYLYRGIAQTRQSRS